MSDPDRPISAGELEPLLEAFSRCFEGTGAAFQALFHQIRANSLVCALLLREMTKAGLIEPEALKEEALAAADKLELPGSNGEVAKLITSIFGGAPAEIPPQVVLRVIQGGLNKTAGRATPEPATEVDDHTG
ncbi:hypothetical protein [Methylobacterium sp. 092160098-2]|jgi:hypothetical protein|uniref:hypothetical protein n=1 Tax=Methylobacterium sp. 092160098-2 TaxID=3025129 RepID=UPI0023819F4D|nr:hypothetical protein [Methylobacterium sp. 092160098-2]MDE4914735.1 hypothetical protein [Methylobacterium sp. 092160098-2]